MTFQRRMTGFLRRSPAVAKPFGIASSPYVTLLTSLRACEAIQVTIFGTLPFLGECPAIEDDRMTRALGRRSRSRV